MWRQWQWTCDVKNHDARTTSTESRNNGHPPLPPSGHQRPRSSMVRSAAANPADPKYYQQRFRIVPHCAAEVQKVPFCWRAGRASTTRLAYKAVVVFLLILKIFNCYLEKTIRAVLCAAPPPPCGTAETMLPLCVECAPSCPTPRAWSSAGSSGV